MDVNPIDSASLGMPLPMAIEPFWAQSLCSRSPVSDGLSSVWS